MTFVTAREIFNGTGNGLFSPNDSMTRAMLAQVLYNYDREAASGVTSTFSDVVNGEWYTDAVSWAASVGVVNGFSNGTFHAADNITREQLVTMVYRYAAGLNYDLAEAADVSTFTDGGDVSEYARAAMRWAIGAGLIQGTDGGRIDPNGNATRAQVAAIMERMVRWMGAR